MRERTDKERQQLQELYKIDNPFTGNVRLAWYGQLRAEEYTHEEAIQMTIEKYNIDPEHPARVAGKSY